jgi:hypothetical protein
MDPASAQRRFARPVATAIGESASLAGLLARLAQSQARWAAVAPLLTPELAALARPGTLDDKGWVIVAEHASAAAKLRHCLPEIEAALSAKGWAGLQVKIKVRPRLS